MLLGAAAKLKRLTAAYSDYEKNSVIETLAVHARNLAYFLFAPDGSTNKDNVFARDVRFTDDAPWLHKQGGDGAEKADEIWYAATRQISHVGMQRKPFAENHNWVADEGCEPLLSVLIEFLETVRPSLLVSHRWTDQYIRTLNGTLQEIHHRQGVRQSHSNTHTSAESSFSGQTGPIAEVGNRIDFSDSAATRDDLTIDLMTPVEETTEGGTPKDSRDPAMNPSYQINNEDAG